MNFEVINQINSSGNGKWSEDDFIIMPNLVVVMDGATSIKNRSFEGYQTFARWFVCEFKKTFLLRYESECHIPSLVKQCVNILKRDYPLLDIPFYEKPTFTFSAIQIVDDTLKCFTIGDCNVYILLKNGSLINVYDKRVDKFSHKTLLKLQYAIRNNLDVESHVRETRIANLKSRNMPNGFWVVAYDGNYENEFVERGFNVNEIDSFLICSDGFNRVFKEFSILTPIEILERQINIAQALEVMRKYEEMNNSASDYPCVKKSDDATAVLASFH